MTEPEQEASAPAQPDDANEYDEYAEAPARAPDADPEEKAPPVFRRSAVRGCLLPLGVVVLGAAAAAALILTRPRPEKSEREEQRTLVAVTTLQPVTRRVTVEAAGTVQPARQIVLQPEVSGRIVKQSPHLVPGGILPEGSCVVRIDPENYELLLKQRKADLARAEANFQLEEGQQAVAEREWKLLESETDSDPADRALALRKPQLAQAEAAVQAARAAVDRAERDLERTEVKAPFRAVVLEETVDIGAQVGPQSRIATLAGAERFWVHVAVPVDRLRWIDIPANGAAGSPVEIHPSGNGDHAAWRGRVVRRLADLDEAGRMARLLIEVRDPLGCDRKDDAPPLLLNSYVTALIQGRELKNVFAVPRPALRDGDRVWIMTEEDTLAIRPVTVVWKEPDVALVAEGLRAGERLVVSPLAMPVNGMKLRVETAAEAKPAPDQDTADATDE